MVAWKCIPWKEIHCNNQIKDNIFNWSILSRVGCTLVCCMFRRLNFDQWLFVFAFNLLCAPSLYSLDMCFWKYVQNCVVVHFINTSNIANPYIKSTLIEIVAYATDIAGKITILNCMPFMKFKIQIVETCNTLNDLQKTNCVYLPIDWDKIQNLEMIPTFRASLAWALTLVMSLQLIHSQSAESNDKAAKYIHLPSLQNDARSKFPLFARGPSFITHSIISNWYSINLIKLIN